MIGQESLAALLHYLEELDEDHAVAWYNWTSRAKALVDSIVISSLLMFLGSQHALSQAWTFRSTMLFLAVLLISFTAYHVLRSPLQRMRETIIAADHVPTETQKKADWHARILHWVIILLAFILSGLLDAAQLQGL